MEPSIYLGYSMVPYQTGGNLPDLHTYRYHQEILATHCNDPKIFQKFRDR